MTKFKFLANQELDMNRLLTTLIGYVPETENRNFLNEQWKKSTKRGITYAAAMTASAVLVTPLGAIPTAIFAYLTARELSKLTYTRIRGYKLGYDVATQKPLS